MKILLINYEYPPLGGGAGKATAAIGRELAAMGHAVRVLTTRFGTQPPREVIDGVQVVRVNSRRRTIERSTPVEMLSFMLRAVPAALSEARRERPDVTIAFFGIPSGPVALVLKLAFGVPYIVSLRGGDVPGSEKDSRSRVLYALTGPVTRLVWWQAAGVVANSAGLRALAQRTMQRRAVGVIPNGVDLRRFDGPRVESAPPRVLFVGRIVAQKGLDDLVAALAMIADVAYTLVLVGDGDARQTVETDVAAKGLSHRARFTGWLAHDGVAAHYREAAVLVLPSLGEGMSNVVLEAMAAGLPVVATRIAGSEELVIDGETGLLVPVRDPAALAVALRRLLGDAALRQRMGAASRARAEGYSWRATAEAYAALCAGLVG